MELAYVFLAEAAEVHSDGRFFIFGGGIEVVLDATFPATLPAISLLAKLRISESECEGLHQGQLISTDPSGNEWMAPIEFSIGPTPKPIGIRNYAYHIVCLALREAPLRLEGEHVFRLFVNRVELGSTRLFIQGVAESTNAQSVEKAGGE